MGSVRRRIGTAALLTLLALCAAPASAATDFPSIGLGGGKQGEYEWSAKAVHPAGPAGARPAAARRPCLVVNTTWQTGRFDIHRSISRQCVLRTELLTATSQPLIASGAQPSSGGDPEMTAVGMIFAPSARTVQVEFCDGGGQTIQLHSLDTSRFRDSGLRRFSYAAFAVRGSWCAARISALDGAGRVLWDSGNEEPAL